jgi:hypothetical protein
MPIGRCNPATASTRVTRSPSFFVAQSYLSSVLASLWGDTWCARVGHCVDWSLTTSAYDSVPARCAVGLRGCGYRPLIIGIAAAFALVIGKFFLYSNTLWIAGLALLIFASFWNAWQRERKRACGACVRGESHENHLHQNLERG